jgi:L-seryl-tRNA(Ser) seleniumtransferase
LELSKQLKDGEVAIYLRDYQAKENWLEIDLRSINQAEMTMINQRINEILGGHNE